MLDERALRELVEQSTDRDAHEPFGAYVFGPDEPGAVIGRHVEQVVFLDSFGNTPDLLAEEYGPYDATSIQFCVVDHRRRVPAGTMRMILPDTEGPGLKSLNDLVPRWGPDGGALLASAGGPPAHAVVWDIATLAVMPEYQGAAAAGLVSLALYQSAIRTARVLGVDWMVAILDAVVYRMTRLRFQSPFVPFAPGLDYLGSTTSYPVYLHISDWKRRLEAGDAAIHDVIFEGRGVEPALRQVDPTVVARLVAAVGGAGSVEIAPQAPSGHSPRLEHGRTPEHDNRRRQAAPPGASAIAG